jgi:ABC-2 type transport system ATP-binding protein
MTTSAISIADLSQTYSVSLARLKRLFRRGKDPVEALCDVSLEVKPGEVFGLIGRNGAGKTTLTKIIATLIQPTAGSVKVNGFDSVTQDVEVRNQIGLATAEERSFYWRLTAEQNLLFFARLYGIATRTARARIAELMERLELTEVAGRRFGELSTGNKQRLAVARALLPHPPVLLLDEPTRSLDPLAASRMREMIKSMARTDPPTTIFFTSHNLAEVETLCDRVAIISRGRLRAVDSPAQLRNLASDTEKVRLSIGGWPLTDFKLDFACEIQAHNADDSLRVVSFERRMGDDRLDECVRAVQAAGGSVKEIEIERATLFDALEIYESEQARDREVRS